MVGDQVLKKLNGRSYKPLRSDSLTLLGEKWPSKKLTCAPELVSTMIRC